MIESQERVTTNSKVEVRAEKTRAYTKAHLKVEDVIKFADALKHRNAPLKNQIRAVLVDKESSLIFSLATFWSTDLIDGEPAPQVLAEEDRAEKKELAS